MIQLSVKITVFFVVVFLYVSQRWAAEGLLAGAEGFGHRLHLLAGAHRSFEAGECVRLLSHLIERGWRAHLTTPPPSHLPTPLYLQIPLHPLLDGLIQEVINLAFKHFKYKEG